MQSILIEGGTPLAGDIIIQGSKNAALPILAACVLTDEISVIRNVPYITDVENMLYLLQMFGAVVSRTKEAVRIDTSNMQWEAIEEIGADYEPFRQMRASIILLGPLLGKYRSARIGYPGGCNIGARPFDIHINALTAMGAEVKLNEKYIQISCPNGLNGADIRFQRVSVGATENAILAAVLAKGTTYISGAAREPEIVMLCECLQSMGAIIEGVGSASLRITGRERLCGADYRIGGDRIAAGTYLTMAAMCGGELTVRGIDSSHLDSYLRILRQTGCRLFFDEDSVSLVMRSRLMAVGPVTTEPFPGFPTDLQPLLMAAMCIADGKSMITETIFENRFTCAEQLRKMGAVIELTQNRAVIYGDVSRGLRGTVVEAKDLRGGAALLAAGLSASGVTQLFGITHLLRGYERPQEVLKGLGAKLRLEQA